MVIFFVFLDSICLLLKAAEYSRADELAERWLSCEENFLNHKYLKITELYVKHVLLPQGLHRRIDNFLEGNEALTLEQKQVRVCVLSFFVEKKQYIIIIVATVFLGKRSCFETHGHHFNMHTLRSRSYFLLKDNSNHEVLTLWLKRNEAISLSCNTIIILNVLN